MWHSCNAHFIKQKVCREAIETKNKHAISYLLEALLFSGAQVAKKE